MGVRVLGILKFGCDLGDLEMRFRNSGIGEMGGGLCKPFDGCWPNFEFSSE